MRALPVGVGLPLFRIVALAWLGAGLFASSVSAQVVTPFTARFQANAPGAVDLVGNTSMTCPLSAPACASARNGTAAGNGNNNNNYNMVQVDVDQDPSTFNSSRAVLAMPAGAEVLWAGLYWGGDTSAGTGGVAAPNAAARTQVRFATPADGSYLTLSGTLLGSITTSLGTDYGVFADVTTLVQEAGNGAYTVANVQTGTGVDRGGGWSLVAAYRAPGFPARNLVVFDGFANVSPNTTVTIDVAGFVTPPAGVTTTQLGSVVWEGDLGFSGDSLRLDGNLLSNALNPADNFFNGSVTQGGVRLTAKTPNYVNQLSFDVDRVSATGVLPNGSTSARITLQTTQDAFYPGAVTFTTDIYSPTLTAGKSSLDLDGGLVRPGDVIEYTVSTTNTGLDSAVDVVLTDPIPPGTTYVPGSLEILSGPGAGVKTDAPGDDSAEYDPVGEQVVFRLGTGAGAANGGTLSPAASTVVRFAVQVDAGAADGTGLVNQARLDYRAAILGTQLTSPSTVTTEVVRLPVLDLVKADVPDPVAAGDLVTYTLSFVNVGSTDAENVVLVDTLPAQASFVSATAGGTEAGGQVTWSLGTLAPSVGGSVSVTVRVDSPLANGTQLTNSAVLQASNAASVPATAQTTVTSQPVLTLQKNAAPDPVSAGGTLTYLFSFTNIGSDTAANVVLVDTLPAQTSFVSSTAGGTEAGGQVTWSLGALPGGSSGSVSLTVAVAEPLPNGTVIANSATLGASNAAPVVAQAEVVAASAPRLELAKRAAPAVVEAGGELFYTLDFSNRGTDAADGVFLVDTLPSQVSFVSASGGGVYDVALNQVVWDLGTLAAGAAGSVSMTVQVASPLPDGTLLANSARLSATDTAPADAAASTPVTSAPVLSLVKTGSPDPVVAGEVLTFNLSFANDGNADATGVVLDDALPDELTFLSATVGGIYDGGTRTVRWTLGTLAAGTGGSVSFTASVASPLPNGTRILNAASLSSDQVPPIVSVIAVTVSSAPRLELAKRAAPEPVEAGGSLVYVLDFANVGNDAATNVVLEDVLPPRTFFLSATGGGTFDGDRVTWTLGTLAAGAAGSVSFTVQVDSPLADGTRLVNVATLSSTESAPMSAQAETPVSSAPALGLSKTASPEPVTAGGELVYTLTFSNAGNDAATGVLLEDFLPARVDFVSASAGGVYDPGSRTVTWDLGTLPAGASGSVSLVVQVQSPLPDGTRLLNVASLGADGQAPLSAQATSTVSSAPVLGLVKSGAPDPTVAGGLLVYRLDFANLGNADALDVVLDDALPPFTSFVSATAGGVYQPADRRVEWMLGTLAAGATGSVSLTVQVDSPLADGTRLLNTATLGASNAQPVSAAAPTLVSSAPRLTLQKSASPEPVAAGGALVYVLDFANVGNDAATNVVLEDVLPPRTVFLSATGGGTFDGDRVTWMLGTLAAGATGSVSLTVQVDSPIADGTRLVNTATLSSADTPPVSAQAVSTASSAPVLTLEKTASVDPVVAGGTLVYTLGYANVGADEAGGVTLVDPLPASVTFISASGGGVYDAPTRTVTWNLGTLAPGESGLVTLEVQVASPLPDGTSLLNVATLSSLETPPITDDAVVTVVSSGQLTLAKTAAPSPVDAGQVLVYTLDYGNTGSNAVDDVVLVDSLPPQVSFVSASAGGVHDPALRTVTWTLGTLSAASSGSVTVSVQVVAPATAGTLLLNTAALGGTGVPSVTASAVTPVRVPLLALEKTSQPSSATAGDVVLFELFYANLGDAPAGDLVLVDLLPPGTEPVSISDGGVYDPGTGEVRWLLGTLAPGASGTVAVEVRLLDPVDPLVNRALLTSAETLPVGAQAEVTISAPPTVEIPTASTTALALLALLLLGAGLATVRRA